MDKNKIQILGNGYLAKEFIKNGFNTVDSSRFRYDLTQTYEDVKTALLAVPEVSQATVLINCIGISNTRDCEDRRYFNTYALPINGFLPGMLSRFCEETGKKLVHISTGCLYDNRGYGLCKETDLIAAHCNYTLSKWVGENGCNKDKDLILRPRLYFNADKCAKNLICKFNRFDKILNEFNSVTSLQTIVEATVALLEADQVGIFNVANDGAYTVKQLSEECGYTWRDDQVISQEDLHKSQGLYLVNNVMDLTKLKQFYEPLDALNEIRECSRQIIL